MSERRWPDELRKDPRRGLSERRCPDELPRRKDPVQAEAPEPAAVPAKAEAEVEAEAEAEVGAEVEVEAAQHARCFELKRSERGLQLDWLTR